MKTQRSDFSPFPIPDWPELTYRFFVVFSFIIVLVLAGCDHSVPGPTKSEAKKEPAQAPPPPFQGEVHSLALLNIRDASMEVVLTGLEHPWAFEFLNPNEVIITELAGRLLRYRIDTGTLVSIDGLPEIATDTEQSGLLDVELHPDFASNQRIYFSYVSRDEKPTNFRLTAVQSAILQEDHLLDSKQILAAKPFDWSPSNFGGALEFDAAGFLYVSIGDRSEHHYAQDGHRLQGKILRLHDDGSTPKDNPFVKDPDVDDRIYALGVRNPQGLHFDLQTGILFESEHGPMGGDEVNRIFAGANYGWPAISYGKNYVEGGLGEVGLSGTHKQGMEQPLFYYLPSIAVSVIEVYRGKMFGEWEGHLLVGTLKRKNIRKLDLDGEVIRADYPILKEVKGRIRDLKVADDGSIYILSQTGTLFRLFRTASPTPAKKTNDAEMIYDLVCSACHDTGADQAPVLSARESWSEIAKQPLELTYKHVIEGYNAMPARGLCNICTDEHLQSTVDYMFEKVRAQE